VLGPLAYQAVDATVKGDIVTELMKLSNTIDDSVSKFGTIVPGIRAAYNAFVQHLRNDGISALEAAMGQKAR
jgi:hydroxymethylglutaryl-CoA reductase